MDKYATYHQRWYIKNKARVLAQGKKWQLENPTRSSERRRERTREIKSIIFSHYGKKCACCSEKNIAFLTIDHKNNDGADFKSGKNRRKGLSLYTFLVARKFPKNVQILCFNCNIAKYNNMDVCPHVDA